jgi:predicted O-methyltransferase YrrM
MRKSFDEIEGWLGDEIIQLFDFVFSQLADNSIIVNVGTYKGKSLSLMLSYVEASGKSIKIYSVDDWSDILYGDDGQDIKSIFIENMQDDINKFELIELDTCDASKLFNNNSIDFVFLDTQHSFTHVSKETNCWMPKVKKKGIISGHDYHWENVKNAVDILIPDVDTFISSNWFEATFDDWYNKWKYIIWYKQL